MKIFMLLWAIIGLILFFQEPLDTPESYNDDSGLDFGDLWLGPGVWSLILMIIMVYLLAIAADPLLEILRELRESK